MNVLEKKAAPRLGRVTGRHKPLHRFLTQKANGCRRCELQRRQPGPAGNVVRIVNLKAALGSLWQWTGQIALILALVLSPVAPARADLRTPVWYDQNAVVTTPDWHYRVPISIPAGAAINSTIKTDVDFTALLTAMGVSGTLDVNSPRIVRTSGALVTTQEFTDVVYAGATDPASNNRGEVRFILQDAGPVTYYLYFDITANGAKPVNPQTPVNGNFERGGTGTGTPPGWNAPVKANANYDAQIRPSESVNVTASPAPAADGVNTRLTDGSPLTGSFSYLIGWRNTNAQVTADPGVSITRTIVVPATNPGSITFRWRVEGWDSFDGGNGYDVVRVSVVGATTTEIVGPTAGNYTTKPFSPNIGTPNAASAATTTNAGYRQYNGFDCNLAGTHLLGMTIPCRSEPWFTATQSLAAYAGQTITFRIAATTETADISWYHFDDVEWSVVVGTLGIPEAFGVNITTPAAGGTLTAGSILTIRAQVDAQATATTNPVTANIYNYAGTLVAAGVRLYDNGTHGDTTANDGIWTNNGSVGADPTYTIPAATITSTGWIVRVFARDQSTSTIGAQNGLAHIPAAAAPEVQANFYNIDEILFNVSGAPPPQITVVKSLLTTSDPFNATSNPKAIPGGEILYTLLISNSGTGPADSNSIVVADAIPANTELFVGDLNGAGSGPVIFINGSPASGLTYTYVSLASVADNLDFSSDSGTTWTYVPVPVGGYDALVTNIRVRPQGILQARVTTAPNFEIRFRVRVK
jgi:uncharacterized repeat protein (TIGR01451 family)